MASGDAAESAANKVIGVIGDEDTVTGFLLAGVGQKDAKGTNFLVVGASAWLLACLSLAGLAPSLLQHWPLSFSLCILPRRTPVHTRPMHRRNNSGGD